MSKLRLRLSISLDGFAAGPNQSVDNPLGEGGMHLHDWVFPLAAWRAPHGLEGGEVNESTRVVEESLRNIGTTFTFVTEGIESALEQATRAAKSQDVALAGGASVCRQYFAKGLVDEMELSVVPMLLGSGERLFDGTGTDMHGLQLVRTVVAPGVAHLKFSRAGQ